MIRLPNLQFPPEKEAAYRNSILQRIVLVSRVGLGVGTIAIPAFIFNDLLFDPDAITKTLPVRLILALLNMVAFVALFVPRVKSSPSAIRFMFSTLFLMYSFGLVLIQAGHTNGFLVSVPGYIQVMIFIPIICFSFLQALGVMSGMVIVAVVGSKIFGASDVELANLINWLMGSGAFALGAAIFVDWVSRRSFELELELNIEKARSDELLLNVLPEKIAERLKNNEERIADYCPCVTVLFADIAGFTALSRTLQPAEVVDMLNDLFFRFDDLAEEHQVEKIKTIGDGYMAVAGLNQTRTAGEAAKAVAALALEMQRAFDEFKVRRNLDLALRIGIHSGPVVAGVIGARKFAFDLWGDTVNVASRIENNCPPGKIQVSAEVASLISPDYEPQPRGDIDIRGHQSRQVFILETSGDQAAPESRDQA